MAIDHSTPTSEDPRSAAAAPGHLDLDIEGMTCASCASRVQRAIAKAPGIERAAVNLATGRARVEFDPVVTSFEDLVHRVEATGYAAAAVPAASAQANADPADEERRRRLWRVLVAWPLGLAVMVVSFGFDDSWARWAALALAAPVQFWAGAPILRSGLIRARHGTANMDTLIAMGTLVAFGYSTIVLLSGDGELYFETAALIMAFVLLGRLLRSASPLAGLERDPQAARARRQGGPPAH